VLLSCLSPSAPSPYATLFRSASCRARWCAPATAPAACTSRRSRRGRPEGAVPRDTTILGAMSKKPTDAVQERPGRLKQIRMVAQLLRKADPKALPIVFASAAGALVVVVLIGVVFGRLWFFVPMGILTALAVGMIV